MKASFVSLILALASVLVYGQNPNRNDIGKIIEQDELLGKYLFVQSDSAVTLNDSVTIYLLKLSDNLVCSFDWIYTVKNGEPFAKLVISEECDHPQDIEMMKYFTGNLITPQKIEITRVELNIFTEEETKTIEHYAIKNNGSIERIKNAY